MRSILKKNEMARQNDEIKQSQPAKIERTPSEESFAAAFQTFMGDQKEPTPKHFEKNNTKKTAPKSPAPISALPKVEAPKATPKLEPQQPRLTPKPEVKKADTSFNGSNGGNKSFNYDEDIDWASSDEEIVKQQIATFERNQVYIIFLVFVLEKVILIM